VKYQKKSVDVLGKEITYIEAGNVDADPIVFLHGNPTSSYLWRNVIPHLEKLGRCIAPDLIGMGDSEKLPASFGATRYNFHVHYEYLRATLEALDVNEKVTLVLHDWGSVLGFHWANQYKEKVKAIVYMEALVMPIEWDDMPEGARGIFKAFRSEKGEDLILERNAFVEKLLTTSVMRDLTEEEMTEYRKPFLTPEDRQPTLNWPRSIPIGGQPVDVMKVMNGYGEWLSQSNDLPKLFVNAKPGTMLIGRQREFCQGWPNQQEVTVKGLHYLQEDSPDEIGVAVAEFVSSL